MADGFLISGGQDGVDHVKINLEEVVQTEEGSHERIGVGDCVAGGVDCFVTEVNPQIQKFIYL